MDTTLTHRSRRWLTVLAAMAGATAVSALGPITGTDVVVDNGSGERRIDPLQVTLTALAVGLAGWGLLTLLERWLERGQLVWQVLGGLVLLVSLGGPLAATSADAALILLAEHLVVGGVLLVGLSRSPGRSRRSPACG